jgi:hypothetical protein
MACRLRFCRKLDTGNSAGAEDGGGMGSPNASMAAGALGALDLDAMLRWVGLYCCRGWTVLPGAAACGACADALIYQRTNVLMCCRCRSTLVLLRVAPGGCTAAVCGLAVCCALLCGCVQLWAVHSPHRTPSPLP